MSDTTTATPQPPTAPAPHGASQGAGLLAALTGHQRAFVAAIVAVVALLLGDTGLSARVGSSGVEAAEMRVLRDEVQELTKRVDTLETSVRNVDKGITDINYAIKEASVQGEAIATRLEALVPSVEALTRDRYVREELDKIRDSRGSRGRVPTRATMDNETGDSDGE